MTSPTRAEAGRLGGQATKKKYGADHYRRIGQMGGKARGKKHQGEQDSGCRCGKCENLWCYEHPAPPYGDILTRP